MGETAPVDYGNHLRAEISPHQAQTKHESALGPGLPLDASAPGRLWREALVLAPMAMLLPLARLPGGIAPAGLALIVALALSGVEYLPLYSLCSLLSLLAAGAPGPVLAQIPAYLLASLPWGRLTDRKRLPWLILPVLGLSAAGRIWSNPAGPWPIVAIEAACTAALALVLRLGIPIIRDGPMAAGGSEERIFVALIPLALAILGLSHIRISDLNPALAGAVFVIMLLAYLGGPGLSAGMGLLLAFLPGVGYPSWLVAGGLSLGGLLAGFLRGVGRPWMLFGFGGGFGLAMFIQAGAAGTREIWTLAGQTLAGMGMFTALPRGALQFLSLSMPADRSWEASKRSEQARLRELLSDRVEDLAGIFTQLSRAFVAHDRQAESAPDLYTILDQVVKRNCQECTGFEACWQQNFYASYRELFDLIALAEMNGSARAEHLRGRLARACFQRRKLLEAVETVLSRVRSTQEERQQAADKLDFVADQLEGVASIMASLAGEMRLDIEFRLEIEERLKASFNRMGLSIKSLSVLEFGRDMLEVRIKKRGCLNYFECQYLIAPMVGRLLGHTFTVWGKECPCEQHGDCSFVLVPAGRFQVRHAVGRRAKEQDQCGDNHALIQIRDGRYAAILSDGMGTGAKAARESKATVDLLAQLLSSGVKEDFALSIINSVLMLRTPEERFATIDIALIDLFTGQVELIKVGAAPSYLKHGPSVTAIKATTPPAGILHQIELDRQYASMNVGDYLILVSDGVFSGALGPEETEDWVERALARVEVAGPEPIVDFLLKIAQTNMGEEMTDDVTIIALQLVPGGPAPG